MGDHKIVEEDHHSRSDQILLLTYPSSALYYVQSPSDHSTNTDCRNNELAFISSPYGSDDKYTSTNARNSVHGQDVSRSLLSRYSSSRGSNNSFVHEKKITYGANEDFHEKSIGMDEIDEDDDDPCLTLCEKKQKDQHHHEERKCCEIENDFYDDDDFYEDGRRTGFWRLFSFGTYNSCWWTLIQIFWRILVSFGVALLVFYLATRPPTPKISIEVARIPNFRLSEGVDASGVTTKILNYNCSLALEVDNRSKLFGLHIHPSTIRMSFGPLIFATSGPTTKDFKLYAADDTLTKFKLYIGAKNKAMYGAGRSMQDMLESGKGLPLMIKINLRSNFNVVWNYVKPMFSHYAECYLSVHGSYDKQHQTQAYNNYCKTITTTL
ncbi:hypothetical protein MKW92_047494 [Papaver armeniacum]|nr:hypothetical protein MKW92_047494 [Papaver armeniacum]